MNQQLNKDGKKLLPIKFNPDGSTSVMEEGEFPGFEVSDIATTKKGSEIDRYVYEVDGRKIYEWDQNLEGEGRTYLFILIHILLCYFCPLQHVHSSLCAFFCIQFDFRDQYLHSGTSQYSC